MKRLILTKFLVILSVSSLCSADVGWARLPRKKKPIVVAVIDTGIDQAMMSNNSLCDSGHKDFTSTGLNDRHGHGTHISGLIDQYAKGYIFSWGKDNWHIDKINVDYCQIIIKYYDPKAQNSDNMRNTIEAFRWAIAQHVDIINYSGGGEVPSTTEKAVILEALNKGIKIVAAAGNEKSDIDKKSSHYYPAYYDKRIYIVGNLVEDGKHIAKSSNYGKSVNSWEIGTNVISKIPGHAVGTMTGTSQATAIKTGKLVHEMLTNK
jgi:subtilisin family serine protease